MDNLKINGTGQTPEIIFDFQRGIIKLSGKSYPENVNNTYKELLIALQSYCSNPKPKTTVSFNWLYYNTGTSKIIVKLLADLKAADTVLEVNWIVKKDFKMMVEKAELISEVMDIKMNIIRQGERKSESSTNLSRTE